MKLLLDTPILVWSLLEPERLPERIAAELENPANELWISPVSVWEIMLLIEKGRILLKDATAEEWVRDVLRSLPLKEAPVNHEVAIESRRIDLPHQDPADRFLAATAKVFELTLVTADSRLLHSTAYAVLAAS